MEIKYDQLDFENVNTDKKISFIQKALLIVLVVLIICTPLYEISPDAFPKNEIIGYYYTGGCFPF